MLVLCLALVFSTLGSQPIREQVQNFLFPSKPIPASTLANALYPDWAHDHWVWLHASISNQTSTLDMVNQYRAHNITIGAVDIDSAWSTGFNNFVFDTKKFPDAAGLVKQLHSMGIRVILWATSMINDNSPNFQEGLKNNYYLNNGTLIKWWHGHGAFIDYTYPAARDWWHKQMDLVLDIGVDGWKCDGTDPFVFELFGAVGWGGSISERHYADAYYRDYFYYSRSKNPDALIMSRPTDSYPPIYWDFSPRDVVFSGWVGDQDPTFDGLKDAIRNCFKSAWSNYVNFGSDIGGYRSKQTRTRSLFLRWAQFGAFMPLMENGGGGPHFPWLFEPANETVQIYRNFVNFHYSLKPYFLTAGSIAYETGGSVITPLTEEVIIPFLHGWDYMLWRDILVAPIVEDSLKRKIFFPKGNDWVYWFDSSRVYRGGSTHTLTVPLNEFPVFHRRGSIIPLSVNAPDSIHAHHAGISDKYITALIHPIPNTATSVPVRRWNKPSIELSYSWFNGVFEFQATSTTEEDTIILRINGISTCSSSFRVLNLVTGNAVELFPKDYNYYCEDHVDINVGPNHNGTHILIEGLKVLEPEELL